VVDPAATVFPEIGGVSFHTLSLFSTRGDAAVVDSVIHRSDTLQKWERHWHAVLLIFILVHVKGARSGHTTASFG
jgi:hypothetical protein